VASGNRSEERQGNIIRSAEEVVRRTMRLKGGGQLNPDLYSQNGRKRWGIVGLFYPGILSRLTRTSIVAVSGKTPGN